MEGIILSIIAAVVGGAIVEVIRLLIRRGKPVATVQTLYREAAARRYEALKNTLPKDGNGRIDPSLYGGGNIIVPQWKVERYRYDPLTMESEWKGFSRMIQYFYKNAEGKTMVEGWRLK